MVHGTNRARTVHRRAGGKGINVARVLPALGHDVVVSGLTGGGTGDDIRRELAAAELRHELVGIAGESRRTVTIVDDDATVVNEPGPAVTPDEWDAFPRRFTDLGRPAEVVVVLATAAALDPVAGAFDPGAHARFRPTVSVEEGRCR